MSKFPELFKSIDWHDLPLKEISINSEEKSLRFLIAPYNEELDDYDYFNLRFLKIQSINTSEGNLNDLLSFDLNYLLEFNYCEYTLDKDGTYHFEFLILLGSRKPVIKFEISASKVTLKPAV